MFTSALARVTHSSSSRVCQSPDVSQATVRPFEGHH